MKKSEHPENPSSSEPAKASAGEVADKDSSQAKGAGSASTPPTEPTIKQTLQKLVAAVEELRPKPKAPRRLEEIFEHLNALVAGIAKTTGFVLLVLIISLVVIPVFWQKAKDLWTGKETIMLESFEVAPDVEKDGLTSRALANKLAVHINNVRNQAGGGNLIRTDKNDQGARLSNPSASSKKPLIDIEIPGTKLSLQYFVQYVADLFGKRVTGVDGDLTRQGDNLRLIVRLTRDAGGENKRLERTFEGKDIDSILLRAAQYVLTYTESCTVAVYQYNSNDKESAFVSARYCLSHSPSNDNECYAHALSGLILTDQGNLENESSKYDEAVGEYDAALKKCPGFEPAIINWGYTLEQQDKLMDALQKYQEAVTVNPKSGLAYVRRGLLFLKCNMEEEALAEFNRAATEVPDYPWSYIYVGQYYRTKADKERDEAAKKSYKADKERHEVAEKSDNAEAVKRFQMALAADPEFHIGYYYWGRLLARNELYYDEAIEKYRKAIELNPGFADAYFQWGNILINTQKYAEAREKFAKTLELDPKGLYANLYLGAAFYFEKNYEEARAYFEKEAMLAEKQNNKVEASVAYNNLGDALFDLKRPEEAREKYNRAIELDPECRGGRKESEKSLKSKFNQSKRGAKCK